MRYQEQQNIVAPAGMAYGVRELVDPMEYAECAPNLPNGDPALRMAINAEPKWYATSSPIQNNPNWADCALPDASGGQGNYWHLGGTGGTGCTPGNSLNGKPSIDFDGVGFLRWPTTNPTANSINLNAFSMVCVYGGETAKTNVLFALSGGDPGLMLYTASTGIRTRAGGDGTTVLAEDDPGWVNGAPKVAVVTFSTTLGTTLRRNGVQRAADPNRKTAPVPTANRLFIGGYDGITSTQILSGAMANIRIYNFDLSAPENGAALKAVEDAAIARFNITRGA